MIAAPSSHFEFKKNCNVLIVVLHNSPVIFNLDGLNSPPIDEDEDEDETGFGLAETDALDDNDDSMFSVLFIVTGTTNGFD